MGLKEKIKDFNLRDNEGIDKDDNNGKISEAFKPIAETILSGHFKVTLKSATIIQYTIKGRFMSR